MGLYFKSAGFLYGLGPALGEEMKKTKKATKPAKKSVTRSKRRVCKTKRCMKTAINDGIFCPVCIEKNDGPNVVEKVTEVEALRFAKLDMEIRNDEQAIKILDYEYIKLKESAELRLKQLTVDKQQLQTSITARRPAYTELVKELAEKYGIADTSKMTIDPDTGVIRDLAKT